MSNAADPTDANNVHVAPGAGGIWHTSNATAAVPTWTPLTDQLGSLSFTAIAFDPLDATKQTSGRRTVESAVAGG